MGARCFTDDEKARAEAMKAEGRNMGEIARELGRSRSGIERYLNDPFSLGLTCVDCASPISDISTSGRCRSCNTIRNNKNPALSSKRAEGRRRAMKDPAKYAVACETARNNIRKAMADPIKREKAAERGRILAATYFNTPEMRERLTSPEMRKRVGKAISETRMAWCPPAYRETHREIMRSRAFTSSEAMQMIADQIAADKARELANLSPFERQERALAKGARLVANDRGPSFGEAVDHGESKWEVGRVA